MITLLFDECVDRRIVNGLLRRIPGLAFATTDAAGLNGKPDPVVLEWAAANGYVLVSSDVRTMPAFIEQRIAAGKAMPGAIMVPQTLGVGTAIADLKLVIEAASKEELDQTMLFIPL